MDINAEAVRLSPFRMSSTIVLTDTLSAIASALPTLVIPPDHSRLLCFYPSIFGEKRVM
jgi:hypothetical protein